MYSIQWRGEVINMSNLRYVIGAMRAPFLLLALSCAFLGFAGAVWKVGQVDALPAVLAFMGAVAAHACVNAFNEYFDLKSGLDTKTAPTPFSGGDPALAQRPEKAGVALTTAIVSLLITIGIGIYFLLVSGLGLLPVGLAGLLLVILYTVLLTRSPLFCLIAPGLGFGCVVLGVEFALAGSYSWSGILASLVPFFLAADLLLLNQFPDVEADRSIGRRHLPIAIGRRKSAIVYIVFLGLCYVSIIMGVALRLFPLTALLGLLTIAFAIPAGLGAYRYADDIGKLMPSLARNVLINILTPFLTGIGIILGRAFLP
jgi:1,4-dihydroxy-2-naphthoate octaprenyltransferase